MPTQLKTAVVGLSHPHVGGLGPEASGYLQTLSHLRGVQVVAFYENRDERRLQEMRTHYPHAALYSDLDELIAGEDFDLAWVVLPAAEVPAAGIKLAEAGKHFYMEKQFARTSQDLRTLLEAVRRHDVRVLPGYPHRFNPVIKQLRGLVEEGVIGTPLDLEVRIITGQVRGGVRDPASFLYSNEDEGGGILHMLGGHYLEMMRFLMCCEVRSVQAMAGRPVGAMTAPLEDVITVAMEFENGAAGCLHAGYLQRTVKEYDTSLILRGLEGELRWEPIGAPVYSAESSVGGWQERPKRTVSVDFEPGPPGYTGGKLWMFDWLQGFVDAVRGAGQPSLTVEDAMKVLQVIDAAYASVASGRRVEVEYS